MQALAAPTVSKPFVAAAPRAPRSVRALAVAPRAAADEQPAAVSRRALAGLLAAVPVLLPASRALALIPDDDDEELVEKARANRAKRLASERQTEQAFTRSGDKIDRVLEQELIPVQKAINSLASSGAQLEAGNVKAAAATLNGGWVRDFQSSASKLSYTEAAKNSASAVFASLAALQGAASKGSAADAKRSFVAAAGALQTWAVDANVAGDLKGLSRLVLSPLSAPRCMPPTSTTLSRCCSGRTPDSPEPAGASSLALPDMRRRRVGGGGDPRANWLQAGWAVCRDCLEDWPYNAEYDRFYWPLALAVYGSYIAKLLPLLRWQENAQNLVLAAGLVMLMWMSGWRPAAYKRHGALMRLLLLTWAYSAPVLTSMDAMQAFSQRPSQIPLLGPFVDTYSLWLSTRNAFLAWAMLGCRPPLYLAVPYQLAGLLRISRAGFCGSGVLLHPIVQQRTEMAHILYSLALAGLGGTLPLRHLAPGTPEQRCSSLLLFFNLVFAFLLPLLLLVPLRQRPQDGGWTARGGAGGITRLQAACRRADQVIESKLRLLLWSPPTDVLPADEQQRRAGVAPAAPQSMQAAVASLVLRWWALLAVAWTACCVFLS
ncbi:thylakoid lumenal kDa chloroplastic [Micractinium conductrix]|uniref:Thylakoid lumenal kDa chloroplastic n=1 Tax=Micractinium conductrix TaxID=554055 RepID=A0A2P6VK77_9CHLO|nr:thylakoid lumenal kDa chloroplastic [Micractinium conductrix]|eukprot:PSC74478.1 thylakoid lumenal kDa chloroplastic [Micractinium conductrix]